MCENELPSIEAFSKLSSDRHAERRTDMTGILLYHAASWVLNKHETGMTTVTANSN